VTEVDSVGFIRVRMLGGRFAEDLPNAAHRRYAGFAPLRRPPVRTADGPAARRHHPRPRIGSRALRGVGIGIVVHLAQRAHSTADPACAGDGNRRQRQRSPAPRRGPAPAASSISARSPRWERRTRAGPAVPSRRRAAPRKPLWPQQARDRAGIGRGGAPTRDRARDHPPTARLRPGRAGPISMRFCGSSRAGCRYLLLRSTIGAVLFCRELVDLLARAASHPAAAGPSLLCADGTDFLDPAVDPRSRRRARPAGAAFSRCRGRSLLSGRKLPDDRLSDRFL